MTQIPIWLPYVDLGCAAAAGALWYAWPQLGPWPLALVLAPWALRWLLAGRPSRHTLLDLPLLFFLVTAAVGVWAAFHPETAWAKFWILVGALAIYYALANQPDGRHLRVFAILFAFFGAGIVVYFLWTNNWVHGKAKTEALTRLGKVIQAALPPFASHQMQPNVVGGLLAMIVPFQVAVLLDRSEGGRKGLRWLAGLAMALTVFGLLLTTSRGAWLALAAGLALWVLWKVAAIRAAQSGIPHRAGRFVTLVAVAVIVLSMALLLLPNGPQRLAAVVPGQNQLPSRVLLWSRALFLIQDVPLTGGGLDSFRALDSAYAFPIWRWAKYHKDIFVTNYHSHNLWLDVAVEQGLPGLAALLWIQGSFVVMVWRGWRTAGGRDKADPWARVLFEAAVVSALVAAIHALVDDVPYGSRAMLLAFVPMGVVAALAPPRVRRSRRAAWALALPAVLILVSAAALAGQRPLLAAWEANLGAVAQARVELAGYLDEGWSLSRVRAEADRSRAASHFEQALAIDPDQPTANLRLGLIWLGQGDHAGAIPLLERAYERLPQRQAARQALAEAYLLAGRLEESAVLWAGVDDAEFKLRRMAGRYQSIGEEELAADAEWLLQQVSHGQ